MSFSENGSGKCKHSVRANLAFALLDKQNQCNKGREELHYVYIQINIFEHIHLHTHTHTHLPRKRMHQKKKMRNSKSLTAFPTSTFFPILFFHGSEEKRSQPKPKRY
jgi:hypothetical protein